MSRLNQSRCDRFPVYGPDTHDTVSCVKSLDTGNCSTPHPLSCVTNLGSDVWRKHGYVDCLFAQNRLINHNYPDVFWRECSHLQQIVNSPEEWLSELTDVLSR